MRFEAEEDGEHHYGGLPDVGLSAPVTHLNSQQRFTLFYRDLVCCLWSFAAATYILVRLSKGRGHARNIHLHRFIHHLMTTLFIFEMIQTSIWLIGIITIGLVDGSLPGRAPMSAEKGHQVCRYVAPLLFASHPTVYLWHVVIAHSIWAWVVHRVSLPTILRRLPRFLALTLILSALDLVAPLVEQNLGLRPHSTCYLLRPWHSPRRPMTSLLIDKMVLLPLCCVMIAGYNISTIRYMARKARELGHIHDPVIERLKFRLMAVTAIFVIIWLLQAMPLYLNNRLYWVEVACKWATLLPVLDALAFGWPGWLTDTSNIIPMVQRDLLVDATGRRSSRAGASASQELIMVGEGEESLVCTPIQAALLGDATAVPHTIFATTFDMNHSNVCSPSGLESWVPSSAGYHVYVIAVQRCRVLPRLKSMIHAHLGGSAKYVLSGSADLGDAVTGKLALLVFTRTVDVESGAFRPLSAAQHSLSLGRVRGATKGLIGLSFRYHDVSLAFVSAHLPSLSLYQGPAPEAKRRKHLAQMLRSLHLGRDDENWDTHLQHHHVYLLGNMNWRSQGLSSDGLLDHIQKSSQVCQHLTSLEHPPASPTTVIKEAAAAATGVGSHPPHHHSNWRDDAYLSLRTYPSMSLEEEVEGGEAGGGGRRGGRQGAGGAMRGEIAIEDELEAGTVRLVSERKRGVQNAWAWLRGVDGLMASMGRGQVLHGFTEEPIAFPPSFKWNVGASAGDFSSSTTLRNAYSCPPPLLPPPPNRQTQQHPPVMTADSPRQRGGRSVVPPPPTLSGPSAGRIPSYTDRILVHSMPDVVCRLVCRQYELCEWGDMAQSSDHRPVALAATLLLDTTDYCHPRPSTNTSETSGTAMAMAFSAHARSSPRTSSTTTYTTSSSTTTRRHSFSHPPSTISGSGSGSHHHHLCPCFTTVTLDFSNINFRLRGFRTLMHTQQSSVQQEPGGQQQGQGQETRCFSSSTTTTTTAAGSTPLSSSIEMVQVPSSRSSPSFNPRTFKGEETEEKGQKHEWEEEEEEEGEGEEDDDEEEQEEAAQAGLQQEAAAEAKRKEGVTDHDEEEDVVEAKEEEGRSSTSASPPPPPPPLPAAAATAAAPLLPTATAPPPSSVSATTTTATTTSSTTRRSERPPLAPSRAAPPSRPPVAARDEGNGVDQSSSASNLPPYPPMHPLTTSMRSARSGASSGRRGGGGGGGGSHYSWSSGAQSSSYLSSFSSATSSSSNTVPQPVLPPQLRARSSGDSSSDGSCNSKGRQPHTSLPSMVETVFILYPVPSEDPQATLRRLHQVGDTLGSPPSPPPNAAAASTPSMPAAAVGFRPDDARLQGGSRSLFPPRLALQRSRSGGSSTTTTTSTTAASARRQHLQHRLRSLHVIPWRAEYEGGGGGRVRVATDIVLPSGSCPTHCCRHGLIKFLGQGGKELGQGVYSLRGTDDACGRGKSQRKRRTVELSVGGDYRGTVSFDLNVNVKRKNAAAAAAAAVAAASSRG